MGLWTFYFAAKIYLYYKGYIRLDVLLNLLFLIFLIIPIPKQTKFGKFIKYLKPFLSVIFGILLFWHDTWFPTPFDTFSLLRQNGMPSKEYIYSFFLRFYYPKEALILLLILAFCVLVGKYRKIAATGTIVILLFPLFVSSGQDQHQSEEMEKYLSSFYNSELTRLTYFRPSRGVNSDFDVIILHICSLSWDDLQELGLTAHPFFKQFDYLFTNFNSVSTYSNPSAIRLLNANCGQRRHSDLYGSLPKECSMMESLHAQGYTIYFARNHNGKYGNFDDEVRRYGHLDVSPFTPDGLEAKKFMFDNSPVYDDYALLEQWWMARQKLGSKKAALYYNTVSLHDGAHWIADKEWWKKDHKEYYREFLAGLLSDMTKFFKLLASSEREAIVIFVGEHGRAVRGSVMETPGLRDIPLPRITTVPVGIKFIGKGHNSVQPQKSLIISKPASYFAISFMLAAFEENSPFHSGQYISTNFIDSIPQTFFVSENQDNIIVKKDSDYYLFGKNNKWTQLTDTQLK